MLSTLFPPDPTLTVDNISHIMEKVEPTMKMQIWEDLLDVRTLRQINAGYKNISFKEEECANIYVRCCYSASWEGFAGSLYRHHQMAAVKEVRLYLPPKGKPGCGAYVYSM